MVMMKFPGSFAIVSRSSVNFKSFSISDEIESCERLIFVALSVVFIAEFDFRYQFLAPFF
jgi:hypothetical protein